MGAPLILQVSTIPRGDKAGPLPPFRHVHKKRIGVFCSFFFFFLFPLCLLDSPVFRFPDHDGSVRFSGNHTAASIT